MSKPEKGRRFRAAAQFDHAIAKAKPQQPEAIDALLVTRPENIRYLTGFTGSNGLVLLFGTGEAILFTDPRYKVQSGRQCDCKVKVAKGPLTKAVLAAFEKHGPKRIGFEPDSLNVAQFDLLKKGLKMGVELAPVPAMIDKLRMVKDAGEIDAIRASVNANSEALEDALAKFQVGMSEADLAAEIDYANRKRGAEGLAFDTIVATGERAALPHARPGRTPIGPGMLLIDMGVFRDGYASDMTRMVHVGQAPDRYKEVYATVLQAQLAAIDAVRPGARTVDVDAAARNVLKAKDLDKAFVHSTGHGLGLEIHEAPRLGRKDKGRLEAGMAITIEPGVYIEGWGGIRIEDTVLVTETGCEILTPTPKTLREI